MARLSDQQMKDAFKPFLEPGEDVAHVAIGVKQPNILVIILTGTLGAIFLTRNYIIGLTQRRFLALQVQSLTDPAVKASQAYDLASLKSAPAKCSTGPLFTHIAISDAAKPFVAKFHRAYSPTNRPNAMAIAQAIGG